MVQHGQLVRLPMQVLGSTIDILHGPRNFSLEEVVVEVEAQVQVGRKLCFKLGLTHTAPEHTTGAVFYAEGHQEHRT